MTDNNQPPKKVGLGDFDYRRQMCKTCAFRSESVEMSDPDQKIDLLAGLMTGVFLCHETMFQTNPDESKWLGAFDNTRDREGKPCENTDHQLCAGFAALYFPDHGISNEDINIEGHAMERMIGADRKVYAEIAEKPVELEDGTMSDWTDQ